MHARKPSQEGVAVIGAAKIGGAKNTIRLLLLRSSSWPAMPITARLDLLWSSPSRFELLLSTKTKKLGLPLFAHS